MEFENHPQWLENAVGYEIYPQSFSDTNNDGIGDLSGVTQHLDYVFNLGCNLIWLNPCFQSPMKDAGYDVSDYTEVDARYGSEQDLITLFEEAHKRGMHVLLDLVPGHTSDQHPWFIASSNPDHPEYATYKNRYIWTDSWIAGGDGLPFIAGAAPRDGAYIINFFSCQPALNYGFAHPKRAWQYAALSSEAKETCNAMLDVMRYWLSRGADGFRIDMADSLVKGDDEGKPYTIRTWQYMLSQIKNEYPEAAFVSEWGRPHESMQAGFDMDFYLDWRWDGNPNGYNMLLRNTDTPLEHANDASYFNADSGTTISEFLKQYMPQYIDAQQSGGYFSFITGNHDTMRTAPRLSERERALAWSTLLTMPGVPFIYYGDEIGMAYQPGLNKEGGYTRTGSRTPMQWDSSNALYGFSSAPQSFAYLPVDAGENAPTVEQSLNDPDSLYHHIQQLLELRHQAPALQSSASLHVYNEGRMFVFVREAAEYQEQSNSSSAQLSRVIVAVNPSREELSCANIPAQGDPLYVIGQAHCEGDKLTLGAQSFAIFGAAE